MKKYISPILFIGFTVLFAALLMPYTAEPEIYAISNVEEAGVFKNPIALKQISQEKTGDLQPLMQDFFDTSGTIVLNVRFKNFEDAQEDLEEYRRAAEQFDRLVINLDMSESEIGDFRKNNAENLRNLEELLNDSIAFDELNRLEIQYQDENNPAMMYSIAYEGEALREKLTKEFAQYQNNTAAMAQTGERVETNPESMLSSVDVLKDYSNEINGIQEERMVHASETAIQTHIIFQEELTLTTDPSGGIYGDAIHAKGVYSRTGDIPVGEPVTLYIDSREYTVTFCNTSGDYDIPFTINKMYRGTHLVYTRAGDVFSPIVPISVDGTDGMLTLNISVRGNTILSSGSLKTEGRDVSRAPVTLYIRGADNTTETTLYTDDSGAYSFETEVKSGEYTIQSVFSEAAFPVNECQSREYRVSVGQNDLFIYLIVFGIVVAGAGYLALHRKKRYRKEGIVSDEIHEPDTSGENQYTNVQPDKADVNREIITKESITMQEFRSRYIAQSEILSSAEAAMILKEGFISAIRYHTGRESKPSETMREQADKLEDTCRKQAYVFVMLYEAMVYGNVHQKTDDLLLAWDEAVACIGVE